jgi:membrane protein
MKSGVKNQDWHSHYDKNSKRNWKEILLRVKDNITNHHLSIISAGVAFFIFMALFPALAALLSIYGLVMDPQQVQQQVEQLSGILPEQGQQFLSGILQQVAGQSNSALGWGVVLSVLLSLWSANAGTKALFEGVNIVYDEKNTRSFLQETALTLAFTLAAIIVFIISISIIVVFPALIGRLGLPDVAITVMGWVRWLLLGAVVVFAIAAVYKYAPVRDTSMIRWVTLGALVATIMWLVGSLLFSFYVSNFGNFDETYGAVAAVVIMMLWLYLTCFLILIGAEINAEMEKVN